MSVSGLCDVCQSSEGQYSCDRCGQFVCGDHWEATERMCQVCAAGGNDPDQPSGFRADE